MKNYLISKIQVVIDVENNVLGNRICDVADTTFPVSDDYEWKQCEEFFDIYTGAWYWSDKPTEYVAPLPPVPTPIVEEEVVTPVVSEE